jgi:two-component system NtrC family sensor kinase
MSQHDKPSDKTTKTRRRARGRVISNQHSSVTSVSETELARSNRERDEALTQQAVTAEILKVISRSTFDLQAVLDTLVASAVRLCDADTGLIRRCEGDTYPVAATFGLTSEQRDQYVRYSTKPNRGSVFGRAILERRTIHVPDLLTDPQLHRNRLRDYAGVINIRSGLGVPLIREGSVIGVFTLQRTEPQPFTDKQIKLVESFADQAVIAIENTRLLNELRESLQQQTATSEVLSVISSSPSDLAPVFQTMLANATRLCDATFGLLLLYEGDWRFRVVAMSNVPRSFAELRKREPIFEVSAQTGLGRAVATKDIVHIADYAEEAIYKEQQHPAAVALGELGGARTYLVVPMLKDREIAGPIAIYRQQVRPFADKQIELVKNFASQAVIAIENTRLLNELRQRTTDLTESLEQQTATSEVLRVISSSPGELTPVFQTMLENAVRICDAKFGVLYLYEGGKFRSAALANPSPEFEAFLNERGEFVPDPRTALGRIVETRQTVHIVDVRTEPAYVDGEPLFVAVVNLGGYRTLVSVPMFKENELIGAILIYRQEVRPFSEKQIELVKNFASQAVIAIENARLLNELRYRTDDLTESLQQQTATAEILDVISNSPTDSQPAFDAIVRSVLKLFPGAAVMIALPACGHATLRRRQGQRRQRQRS